MTSPAHNDHDVLLAAYACQQLFTDFHCYIDDGHATLAADLFTPNAVFEARGTEHQGIDAIASFLQAREANTSRQTRHLGTDFRFRSDGPSAAQGTARLLLFHRSADGDRGRLEMEAVVDCTMSFARLPNGEWRMTSRRHRRFASIS